MVNYKRIMNTNWLHYKPMQQWYQSEGSKTWGKSIHKQGQMGLTRKYLQRETPQRMLPWNSQKRKLSPESKEILRCKVKEIEAFNASKVSATVKEQGEGSTNT
ncbi:hypothetical protein Tco_1150940 [Tanacetum coccineum]